MNTSILQKCLDELRGRTSTATNEVLPPRIDYVCGMLETLIEMNPEKPISLPTAGFMYSTPPQTVAYSVPQNVPMDEVSVMEASALATVNRLKAEGVVE